MGGSKRRFDFDRRASLTTRVMAFCQSFMTELYQAHRC
ncbi:MAG: hypothetical protein ACLUSL_13355 [Ruminococcus sp.]